MASTLTGLANVAVDLGCQQVLTQRRRDELTRRLHDNAFWLVLGSGLAWALVIAVLGAPGLAWFFGETAVAAPASALAIAVITHALGVVPTVLLTRRMRFRHIVVAETTGIAAGAVVAITLALAGAGVWSLVLQAVLASGVTCGMMWRSCRWRPRWPGNWRALHSMRSQGAAVLGARLIYFLRTQLDNLFVGTLLGASALGIYSLAFMLTEGLRSQLASIVGRVMLPAYSRAQDDPQQLHAHYLSTLRLLTLTVLPASLAALLFADDVVRLILAPRWWDAATPIRILAAGGVLYALSGPCAEVLQAIGRPGLLFRIAWMNLLLVALPATWWLTVHHGLTGAASAFTISFAMQRVVTAAVAMRCIGMPTSRLITAVAPISGMGTMLTLAVTATRPSVPVLLQFLGFTAAFLAFALHTRARSATPSGGAA
jgi:O-antigen/teichoic acid export membrane protein